MFIGSRRKLSQVKPDPDLHIGSEGISRVPSTKTLGVLIDENIAMGNHIDYVAKKAAKGIGLLRRSNFAYLLHSNSLKTIYSAIVLPHFDYCALVWDNCSLALKNTLEKLQNKAALIRGDSYEIRSHTVRSKLGWGTLQERRDKTMSKLMK